MGIGSYFKTDRPEAPPSPTSGPATRPQLQVPRNQPSPGFSEKQASSTHSGSYEMQPPTPRFQSRPQSLSGRSMRSNNSSVFIDEIKHEVMVNYLYQQQCSNLWVSDGSGEIEGVLLRKTRGHYMACPPQLGTSHFAIACAALNVQVRAPRVLGNTI